jgi:hypothetical protein
LPAWNIAVERGDEHPVETGDHVVGHLVRLVLQPLDLVHDRGPPLGVGPEQLLQEARRFDREGRDGAEEVEEFLVARQEPHGSHPGNGSKRSAR